MIEELDELPPEVAEAMEKYAIAMGLAKRMVEVSDQEIVMERGQAIVAMFNELTNANAGVILASALASLCYGSHDPQMMVQAIVAIASRAISDQQSKEQKDAPVDLSKWFTDTTPN